MGLDTFRGKGNMNRFGALPKKEKTARDRKEKKLYDQIKQRPDPVDEEFQRRLERGEVLPNGEEVLSPNDQD